MFIKQGKTNWKYIVVILLLTVILDGGVLAYQYWWLPKEEAKTIEITQQEEKISSKTPEQVVSGFYQGYLKASNCGPGKGCSLEVKEYIKISDDLEKNYKERLLEGKVRLADPVLWASDTPPEDNLQVSNVVFKDNAALADVTFPPIWPNHKLRVSLSLLNNEWKISNVEDVSEEIVKEGTADWQTYRNKEHGFEIRYPKDWNYTILGIPNNPIMFASENIIAKTKESLQNIEGDKDFTLWITVYDKRLFEGGILPYRGKSTEYIQVTSSNVNVSGVKGVYYISKYLKDKGSYKTGEKTVTVDLAIDEGYFSFHLFNYQYQDIFDRMLSTFRFLE